MIQDPNLVLKNWRTITDRLNLCSESEVDALLRYEIANQARASILNRLHQRYTVLRGNRERAEILEGAKHV